MEKILRINMRTKVHGYEDASDEYLKTGGRGLIAKILLKEVEPTCEPLGRYNKLIVTMGLLSGTSVSSASRICIGGKSPLTGGIKESNGGGIVAYRLAQVGIKAIIIEDIPEDKNLYNIVIGKDSCSIEPANEYVGMGTFEYCEKMLAKYPKAAISCIGPSGEKLYNSAGIANLDNDYKPNRYSGRGGLGALMGSKKIKGIIVKDTGAIAFADKEKFMTAFKEYSKIIIDAPGTLGYKKLGTPAMARIVNDFTALPVRNFSGVKFEKIEDIMGETLAETIEERGGEGRTSHACMPGCIIQCSNVFPDKDGKTIVSPLEYETIGLMGSNLGIANFDDIAKLNAMCNDIGVDTIETGAAIGVAMAAGLAEFGDAEAAINMLKEIEEGTILGRLLGSGATTTGKVLGVMHVPAVNGQAMPAYDPRGIKGMGVTYATSPMGADHTYGATARAQVVQSQKEGQMDASRGAQRNMAIIDSLGFCMFTLGAIGKHFDVVLKLVNAKYGWDLDQSWLDKVSEETIRDEYKFNELAGFSVANYRMPESFMETKVDDLDTAFDFSGIELSEMVVSRS